MAQASAKKAAAARSAASKFYVPFFLILNGLYVVVRLALRGMDITFSGALGVASVLALQYASYAGIMDDAANRASAAASTASTSGKKKKSSDLVGGSSLDLLGLTVVVQYGAILVSPKFYYLLVVVPVWGTYKLYQTFLGGGGSGLGGMFGQQQQQPAQDEPQDSSDNDRRQKRAEKRRQKWS